MRNGLIFLVASRLRVRRQPGASERARRAPSGNEDLPHPDGRTRSSCDPNGQEGRHLRPQPRRQARRVEAHADRGRGRHHGRGPHLQGGRPQPRRQEGLRRRVRRERATSSSRSTTSTSTASFDCADLLRHEDRQEVRQSSADINFDGKPDVWEKYDPDEQARDRAPRSQRRRQARLLGAVPRRRSSIEILYDDDFDGKVDRKEEAHPERDLGTATSAAAAASGPAPAPATKTEPTPPPAPVPTTPKKK